MKRNRHEICEHFLEVYCGDHETAEYVMGNCYEEVDYKPITEYDDDDEFYCDYDYNKFVRCSNARDLIKHKDALKYLEDEHLEKEFRKEWLADTLCLIMTEQLVPIEEELKNYIAEDMDAYLEWLWWQEQKKEGSKDNA